MPLNKETKLTIYSFLEKNLKFIMKSVSKGYSIVSNGAKN